MNFININLPLLENDIVLKPNKIELPISEEEKEGCIQLECPVKVGCSDEYFAIKNLFSELTDDYQRAIIRLNLGIGGADSLLWGKIEGNLANQKDLCNFIKDTLGGNLLGILDLMNLELKYWTLSIENKIESLASNIKSLEIIPRYATTNQIPVDVLVQWEYDLEVEAQALNGVLLDPSIRYKLFENVSESFSVRLSYLYNGVWLSRNLNFEISFPYFYGTTPDPSNCNYTIQNKMKVVSGENEYIYVMTKNPSDLAVNGIVGGFVLSDFVYISSVRYYVYKSVHPNLGETTILVYDKE